jgi:hypothetical protein
MQIFFSSIAYLFVYDLDSFPKHIVCYFYPITLERARSVVSLYMLKEKGYRIEETPNTINNLSEQLARSLVRTSKSYNQKNVDHSYESIVYEIYTKAVSEFIKQQMLKIKQ